MQWLNYHHLYYFYIIAKEGSVSRATVKLKLAQSTLSAQLKQFESDIGFKLFKRQHRKLTLTDVGHRVLEYAHEIFSLGNELRYSLGDLEHSLGDSIRIGIVDSVPKQLSRGLFHMISKKHAARTLLTEESLDSLCSRLEKHEIDLILTNDKPTSKGNESILHSRLIGNLEVVFVTSSENVKLKEGFPRSLNGEPIILPAKHSPLRLEIDEHLNIKHIHPKIVAEVDDIELLKMLVIDGYGFTALPLISVKEALADGSLIKLGSAAICHENLWLVTAYRLVQNPIVRDLLENFRPL